MLKVKTVNLIISEITSKTKDEVWEYVAQQYNPSAQLSRTSEHLRKKWTNMKKPKKEKLHTWTICMVHVING